MPFSVQVSEPAELPDTHGGTFLNFLTDPARTATAYTPANYARLVELKRRWDPDGVLRPAHLIGAE
ncbi:BBE domain-containing protein [Nonomuraea sp. NBC_01738]|uniref:BBE domain-containing protein n=1 Tax=Nonomuraea sp. NBC_01738 TaxID=2976003 RepID=UPI002E131C56|nr:BBE domain-containing protein [Nonomuraea sp. NBC_01738]